MNKSLFVISCTAAVCFLCSKPLQSDHPNGRSLKIQSSVDESSEHHKTFKRLRFSGKILSAEELFSSKELTNENCWIRGVAELVHNSGEQQDSCDIVFHAVLVTSFGTSDPFQLNFTRSRSGQVLPVCEMLSFRKGSMMMSKLLDEKVENPSPAKVMKQGDSISLLVYRISTETSLAAHPE